MQVHFQFKMENKRFFWNVQSDQFTYSLYSITKTTIKMLMQEICNSKTEWDNLLREGLILKWQTRVADLKDSPTISIPRSYFYNCDEEVKGRREEVQSSKW